MAWKCTSQKDIFWTFTPAKIAIYQSIHSSDWVAIHAQNFAPFKQVWSLGLLYLTAALCNVFVRFSCSGKISFIVWPPRACICKWSTLILYILRFSHQILLCEKRFGFYFDKSERRNEFLTREKIVPSNHKPRFKRIVFSRAFSRSSRVALSGSFDKIIFSVYSSCS